MSSTCGNTIHPDVSSVAFIDPQAFNFADVPACTRTVVLTRTFVMDLKAKRASGEGKYGTK